ncbi:thiamine phosphate synthase [Oxalobacteraceae bacterium CAVE-383]|nr:thiamine phosphate synthase [Oxalobacteraceae bacterium CAVE-383]
MVLKQGLYLVTPDWDDTERLLRVSEAALRGGAVVLQYRHKTAGAALAFEQADALLALCRRYGVPMIVNDNVGLCLHIDADGIHVGGTDSKVSDVRAAVGKGKIVGASCYGSLALAHEAAQAGASYLAFGGFYPSQVKQYEVGTAPGLIAQAKAAIALPVAVIGGMTVENAAPLVAQGADMVAAISSVYAAAEPQAAARAFAGLW